MKELFRRLFNRKPWWDLESDSEPEPEARRVTEDSTSPLNKVLVRPAVGPKGETKAPPRVEHASGNPKLQVEDEHFNPYNTGAFNRSDSWEKISKQKKR